MQFWWNSPIKPSGPDDIWGKAPWIPFQFLLCLSIEVSTSWVNFGNWYFSNKISISCGSSIYYCKFEHFILLSFVKISICVVMTPNVVCLYFCSSSFLSSSLPFFLYSPDLPKIGLFYWTKERDLLFLLVNCWVFLFDDRCLLLSLIISHTLSFFSFFLTNLFLKDCLF